MWDNEFTIDMLTNGSKVAVNCPSKELERELAALLEERGVRYPNGTSLLRETNIWGSYGEDFCYYVEGHIARRGPKSSTEESPWNRYEKYTFCGEQQDDSCLVLRRAKSTSPMNLVTPKTVGS